jgi:hypothetical protein
VLDERFSLKSLFETVLNRYKSASPDWPHGSKPAL